MASDSRMTTGLGVSKMTKLYRVKVGKRKKEYLLGICGDVYAAMVFVDWFGKQDDKDLHKLLTGMTDDDFEVMIWDGKKLSTANRFCRVTEVEEGYYAVGSGSPHAITAMDCGKSAAQAIQMAIKRDPYSGGRIVTARIECKPTNARSAVAS